MAGVMRHGMFASAPRGTAPIGRGASAGIIRAVKNSESTPPAVLDPDDPACAERLIAAARAVRRHAYAPYSGFAVGAALLDEHGCVHVGCNVENAAYPQGLCAEAAAIGALVAGGGRRIMAAAVVAVSTRDGVPVMPCGGCRQRLRELAAPDLRIRLADEHQVLGERRLGDLLPEGFGPSDVGRAGPVT
jgi:cytidine deaminase